MEPGMKELESLDAAFVIDTFLLLLIGIGPKIALVPFLEVTKAMPEATSKLDAGRMLVTEKVFGFLLAALAVQLALDGLADVGVIHLSTGH
jgi:small neutral amino acid transporter SnatA (MarC family)